MALSLYKCVSREVGRRHLLSEMCRSGPGHLLAHCLRTTEQLSVCVHMFACVCVTLRDIPYHIKPTPNLTTVVPGSGLQAAWHQKLLYLNTFITPSFVVLWYEKVLAKRNVSTMLFYTSPPERSVLWSRVVVEKRHGVIIISQGTLS